MLPRFSYSRPAKLEHAVQALGQPGARLLAGGTDLLGCLRDGVLAPELVVSMGGIADLDHITETANGGLRLGAMVRVAEVASRPRIHERWTALGQAASVVASPQLRNQGTIAGNLCQKPRCWYYRGHFDCLRKGGDTCFAYAGDNRYHCIFGGDACYVVHPSDTAPALVALGATVRVVGPGASSRSLAVENLLVPAAVDPQRELALEPGEIISEIVLPPPANGLVSSYRKVTTRGAWDFALVGCALALVMDQDRVQSASVVLGGVAATPWRARAAEAALAGRELDETTIAAAASAAVEGAEAMRDNAYKVDMVRGLVTEELGKLRG